MADPQATFHPTPPGRCPDYRAYRQAWPILIARNHVTGARVRLRMVGPNRHRYSEDDMCLLTDAIESTERPEPYGTRAKAIATELRTTSRPRGDA